jgi:hypothetical protein
MKPSAATQPVRDGRTKCRRTTSTSSKQSRRLTFARNFSTRRPIAKKAHTGRVDTHTNSEGAEETLANYDEIGHRKGPRKKRTLYIADAKQATGHLITEIQIGQRMLGIIESSARYAQAMEAAARQRQQSYDDG